MKVESQDISTSLYNFIIPFKVILLTLVTPCSFNSVAMLASSISWRSVVQMTPLQLFRWGWGKVHIGTPTELLQRKLSAWDFLENWTKIWPEHNFLTSWTATVIPEIPFWIAKGDNLVRGESGVTDSRIINLGQLFVLGGYINAVSVTSSESQSVDLLLLGWFVTILFH